MIFIHLEKNNQSEAMFESKWLNVFVSKIGMYTAQKL